MEQARKELWRHLEGDILSPQILESEIALRQGLLDHPVCLANKT